MIAVDTNILVYAHRVDSSHHGAALAALTTLATGRSAFAVPYPCLHEFLAIATHPRIYDPPSQMAAALDAVDAVVRSPVCRVIAETPDHLSVLRELTLTGHVVGPKVHDARIAAICLTNGVRELWTADRDFSYFPRLRTLNPLVDRAD